MSTFALAVPCRNYQMLTIIKTIEAFDFLKTQIPSTPTPENNVISNELHSLIKLPITIFITILITVNCTFRMPQDDPTDCQLTPLYTLLCMEMVKFICENLLLLLCR